MNKCLSITWTKRVTKANFGLTSTACVHGFILLHSKVLLLLNKYSIYLHTSSLTGCAAQQQQGARYLAQLQQGAKYMNQQSDQGQLQIVNCTTRSLYCWI